jgi:capsular exopolysaccharide synthesis family protein
MEQSFEQQKQKTATAARELREKLAARQAEIADVKESLADKKKKMDQLSTQLSEVSLMDRTPAVRVHVISDLDPAGPVDRVRPNRNMILLEGLIVGLILGITLAFVDTRMRSVEEVTVATALPILGVIPRMPRSQSPKTRGRKVHLDPMCDVSEAYRAIRTAIFFGPKAKTVLVTSAERSEGKSTLAANLAIAMTETGHRVILLDADLREPMQQTIFSAPNEVGVSSVVAGRAALERAIVPTGIRNLDLMPCGPVPFNPSETINNQMFADLLMELGNRYDYVIVDSPPVMACTDSRILGAMCDLTVMVVRADKSHKRAVADARDGLLGFGANLMGVVVNDGPRDRQRYGYYGGYGYGRRDGARGLPGRNPAGLMLAADDER